MSAPAGWYRQDDGNDRYWDGVQWTGQFREPPDSNAGPPVSVLPRGRLTRLLRTRTAIGVGSGMLGLLLGAAIGVAGAESSYGSGPGTPTRTPEPRATEASTDPTLRRQIAALRQRVSTQQDALASTRSRLAKQRENAASALDRAITRERKAADRRVQAAESRASDDRAPTGEEPRSLVDQPARDTDHQYGTCAEANAAGLGPYRRGVDPEYAWYQDRDGDGVVCES